METIAIDQLEISTLELIERVAQSQKSIVITKEGKPLAQIVPHHSNRRHHKPGELADSFIFETDIVSPLGEDMWDACK